MRKIMLLCAAAIVTGTVGCGSKSASPTDGSADRRDAAADVVVDAGPGDLPQESRDGQDARDGSDAAETPGDTRDGPADMAVTDAMTDGVDAADRLPDAIPDAFVDGADAVDAGDDGAPSDTPMEAGRPYIERACGRLDACACASNESCSFSCPGGDCAVTCAAGSVCTVTCAAPFGCSVGCGSDATCVLACNLGVCAHFVGPGSTLACDPAGFGCI